MSDYYVITDFETTGVKVADIDVPIEIGMLLVDEEYNALDTISCYINPFSADKASWNEYELQAHKIHMIPFTTIKDVGLTPIAVIRKIEEMIEQQNKVDKYSNRYIIMSDNGQFEYNSMQMLYKLANKLNEFPFHYAAWDVNILTNSVQKVMKGKVSHKAIQDVFRTYKTVIRALERNGFRKWEK